MEQIDKKIQQRFKEDHDIDLSLMTLRVLRKSVEEKIINIVKKSQFLHTDYFELFTQYSKYYNTKRRKKERKIMNKIRKIDPDI